jgi:galactokinase
LSSSAALEVATAPLGELLGGVTIDPLEKALLCQKAEHVSAGTPCGVMDQFAVVFGKRGHLLLIDCRSLDRELVGMREGEVSLLIINTMVKHSLSDGGYKTRRDEYIEVAQLLGVKLLRETNPQTVNEARSRLPERLFRRARHITTENERTLMAVDALHRGAWTELGQLMYGSHLSLRDDFNVSCRELDIVVDEARGSPSRWPVLVNGSADGRPRERRHEQKMGGERARAAESVNQHVTCFHRRAWA